MHEIPVKRQLAFGVQRGHLGASAGAAAGRRRRGVAGSDKEILVERIRRRAASWLRLTPILPGKPFDARKL